MSPQRRGPGRALVVMPTYNEAENISRIIPEVLQQGAALDILIVDDNSPDGTARLAKECRPPESSRGR